MTFTMQNNFLCMKTETYGFSEMLIPLNKLAHCHISKHSIGYNDIKRWNVYFIWLRPVSPATSLTTRHCGSV